jgi:hypothetical protein
MRAWQFSANQEDKPGNAASARDAFGLTTTNTRRLDFFGISVGLFAGYLPAPGLIA